MSKTFFSPTIKYIDPNTGIRYIADLIDKGRFLVTKAPDDIGNHDFDCPANSVTGVTQTPGTPIPTLCKSFVMTTLELLAFDSASQTLQIPQPPVFATPNAASFSTAGSIDFMPLLDKTTQGLPCSIRATGTLTPGMAFQNNTLFVQFPGSTIPGSYQFQFVADCETIGLGTQFANYTFGTSMTTQNFTANIVQAPGSSGQASPEGSQARGLSSIKLPSYWGYYRSAICFSLRTGDPYAGPFHATIFSDERRVRNHHYRRDECFASGYDAHR